MPTEKIMLAAADIELGDAWFEAIVNYKDGTSGEKISFSLPANNTAWYYWDENSFKTRQSKLRNENNGTGFAGMTDEIVWFPTLGENNVVGEQQIHDRHGFLVYDYMLDNGKIPESVTVTSTNPFTLYAIDQVPYNDLDTMIELLDKYDGKNLKDVDKYCGIGIEDYEGRTDEEALIAYNWDKALVDAMIIDADAYPNIKNYLKQYESEKNFSVDLSDKFNTELFVKNATTPKNAARQDYLYNFDFLNSERKIGDYTFGALGNNAIKVEKTSSTNVVVDIPEYDYKVKKFGVILDTVEIGNSEIAKVPVTVSYSDGTSENVEVNLYRPDSYMPVNYSE